LDFWCVFRRRTPGPPPFLSMNSTPAASEARRTASSLATVSEVPSSATSARLIVFTPRADSRARSAALHLRRARAALARDIAGPSTNPERQVLAHQVAEAHVDLRCVRHARHQLLVDALRDPHDESSASRRAKVNIVCRLLQHNAPNIPIETSESQGDSVKA
jgi:hypothetical protein